MTCNPINMNARMLTLFIELRFIITIFHGIKSQRLTTKVHIIIFFFSPSSTVMASSSSATAAPSVMNFLTIKLDPTTTLSGVLSFFPCCAAATYYLMLLVKITAHLLFFLMTMVNSLTRSIHYMLNGYRLIR